MTPEDHANTAYFEYNDLASVSAAITQAGADDIAAIVCTPYRHDILRDQEPVEPEFARGVRAICDRVGAALILDDVRCGLRIDPRGSWEASWCAARPQRVEQVPRQRLPTRGTARRRCVPQGGRADNRETGSFWMAARRSPPHSPRAGSTTSSTASR